MAKPKVHIIQRAFLEKNTESTLPGSSRIAITMGMIEYEQNGQKGYMVVDACQLANWPAIEKNIIAIAGGMGQVTHLLMTHLHGDHIQNIAKFEGKKIFIANKTSLLGKLEYGSQEVYSDGYIEVPEIRYEIVLDAHTHDDTVYIIDSANEGPVAFIGDLIYRRLQKMPVEALIGMEKRSSVDPVKKFLYMTDFLKRFPNIEKVYTGHDGQPLTRDDLREYIETLLHNKTWKEYLLDYTQKQQKQLENYRDVLSSDFLP